MNSNPHSQIHQKKGSFLRFLFLLFLITGAPFLLVATPLIGNYTIDASLPTAGTNFQSFNAFASSINLNGVSGNVIVTVAPGTGPYLEQVVFNNIQGVGPNATVTLEGSGELITAITTTTDRHVIRLSNCQYFTINNLHISRDPASTGACYGIHIFSTGNHITISNCSTELFATTSTLSGAYIASGSETSILETGDFHNITISNNSAIGGGYGASVFGLISNLASHISITNNTFIDFHSNGVYLRETDSAVIAGNFFNKSSSTVTSCNAIQIAQAANINSRIHDNDITVSQISNGTMTIRGIYLFNGVGHKVYNNVIHNIQLTSGNFTAIEIRTGATAPEIYFNTISLDNPVATTGTLYGIKEELSNTNSILRDNMISISQVSSGIKTGLVVGSTAILTTAFNSDYNDIWVPGGNVAQKGGGISTITYYPTLSNWQSVSTQDSHSFSTDPIFFSAMIPQPTNGLLDNLGLTIPWILNDITGAIRGNPPDIGAYEFSSGPPADPDSIYGEFQVCENSNGVNYFVSPIAGATAYNWTITGATIINGQGTPSITVNFNTTNSTISVYASNTTGNSNTVSTNVAILPLPAVSFTLLQDSVCLNWAPINLSGGFPLNGTYSGPGIANNVFNPAVAGTGNHTITYTYESTNGCAASASDLITVDICTGLGDQLIDNEPLQVYPNPCKNYCNVVLVLEQGIVIIRLLDHLGTIVKEFEGTTSSFQINTEGLPNGLYFLEVRNSSGEKIIKKLII